VREGVHIRHRLRKNWLIEPDLGRSGSRSHREPIDFATNAINFQQIVIVLRAERDHNHEAGGQACCCDSDLRIPGADSGMAAERPSAERTLDVVDPRVATAAPEVREPYLGYEATREEAMAAFAKNWRGESANGYWGGRFYSRSCRRPRTSILRGHFPFRPHRTLSNTGAMRVLRSSGKRPRGPAMTASFPAIVAFLPAISASRALTVPLSTQPRVAHPTPALATASDQNTG